jgi:myo-inositol-1(or 4)-monophosphatase
LAYVACGRLDGFWESNLKPWDMAAGALMIREAGGMTTDFGGGFSNPFDEAHIVAGNPKLHKELLELIEVHFK